MLKLKEKRSFKKKIKKYKHNDEVLTELETVTNILINDEKLPIKYKDHELKGKFKGIRELHLKTDDLLMYVKLDKISITLVAIGSHSELFNN